jgi:hypothetical protein
MTSLQRITLGDLVIRYRATVTVRKRSAEIEHIVLSAFLSHPICSRRLSELRTAGLQELKHFRSQQLLISNGIKKIDVYLTGLADNPSKLADVQAAIALRQFLQAQKNEAVPPVGTNAFYLGSTMLLWPAFFALVGWLIFIFPPRLGQDALQQLTSKRVLFLWLFIFIFYRWPTWWRNTPLGEEGRKFFGNANFDIDRIGFFVQETLGAGVALLLAVLWLQWSAYYTQVRVQLSARAGNQSRRHSSRSWPRTFQ